MAVQRCGALQRGGMHSVATHGEHGLGRAGKKAAQHVRAEADRVVLRAEVPAAESTAHIPLARAKAAANTAQRAADCVAPP